MPIATFKNKVFQVSSNIKYPLDGLAWSSALSSEAQEKLKSKPSTYIKGEALIPLSFTIPLFATLGINVRKEIESWQDILSKQLPDYFILGSKPISKNKFLLKSVGVSDTQIDGKGNMLKATLKLDFEEYVRAGKAEVKKEENKTATNNNIQPSTYITKPTTKAEVKRENPNASEAFLKLYLKGE
ncbi:phage tail protein [Paenibacillus psychroresistens]|uniref:phage tail protein n=1 Tax=Paenibacillus psychroresistens TaxID=1778678 RepID=UPI0013915D33|nr:phage tail protein [Paenibacillus psychroresistens]